MCSLIFIGKYKVIETVKELKEEFPYLELIPAPGYVNVHDDDCLCPLDLEKMFDHAGIEYEYDGDYRIK